MATKIKLKGGDGGDKVREERAKLTAGFVSSLGIGVIVIGAARPLLDPSLKGSIDAIVVAISMGVGGFLHLFGRMLLLGMREPPKKPSAASKKEPGDDE